MGPRDGRASEWDRGLQALPGRGSALAAGLGPRRGRAERKSPGPAGREVGRDPACQGPGGRRWCGQSGWRPCLPRGRPEAGPRLALVRAQPLPPGLWREAFRTPSWGSPAPLLSGGAVCPPLFERHPQHTPLVGLPSSAE